MTAFEGDTGYVSHTFLSLSLSFRRCRCSHDSFPIPPAFSPLLLHLLSFFLSVYIQYAHVRLASVERNNPNVQIPTDTSLIRTDLLTEEKAHDIVYLLATYPDVVKLAYKESQPCAIVTFAFKLAHAIGSAWDGSEFSFFVTRSFSESLRESL
jgi:hypothetical protein